jgi:hypothetical protein
MLAWIFVIKRLPEAFPTAEGANLAMKVALCPSPKFKGSNGPVIVKPRPEAAALVIVMGAVPEFLNVRL